MLNLNCILIGVLYDLFSFLKQDSAMLNLKMQIHLRKHLILMVLYVAFCLFCNNVSSSPFLLKLPLICSVFPLSGLCYRPYGISLTLLTKKKFFKIV